MEKLFHRYDQKSDMMKRFTRTLCLLVIAISSFAFAQIDTVILVEEAALHFPPPGILQFKSSYATLFDKNNRPYAYSANKESGLGIYDISASGTITPVIDVPIDSFNNLDVSNVEQAGNYLFLGIGDFQSNNAASGMAIVDVSNPGMPVIADVWDSTAFLNGVSHLLVEGDFAYLSMMNDGLLILDVSNKEAIKYVSDFVPDLSFPTSSAGHHQGRGLKYRNDTIFYCYDRGGFRLIDVSDKYVPAELDKYINTTLNTTAAAAYNDVAIKGSFAFLSLDYCGMEVVDMRTKPFTKILWHNPWGCSGTNWNGADLHMNELILANHDSLLFISAGNSNLIVFDVTNPLQTHQVGTFYDLNDSLGTYGVDVREEQVLVSYLNNPFDIPFRGDWGGLKLLSINQLLVRNEDLKPAHTISVYPNPAGSQLEISTQMQINRIDIFDLQGRLLKQFPDVYDSTIQLDITGFKSGSYLLCIHSTLGNRHFQRFLKN